MCCALWAGELYKFQGSAWNRGVSFIWEKRARQGQREQSIFFCWIKVTAEKFLHIWNPESQAGTNEKEERENQRERQSRGTACHRWRFGASAMAMACQSNADWLSKFSWNWLIEMWDYVMLMCLSNAQWPSGHSPLFAHFVRILSKVVCQPNAL